MGCRPGADWWTVDGWVWPAEAPCEVARFGRPNGVTREVGVRPSRDGPHGRRQ